MCQGHDSLAWIARVIQVSDPLFPTGAYAHSMGLEQWAQDSGIQTGEDLRLFFAEHACPALARQELPYLRFVRDAVATDNWDSVVDIEAEIDAWKWVSELRDASIAQGRGRLRLLRKLTEEPLYKRYAEALGRGEVFGHHAVVSALQFHIFDIPSAAAITTYAYQNLANYVSASIKLLRISPEAAQRALDSTLAELESYVAASLSVARDSAGWFAPAFDISAARHATAFSRLFIS